MSKLQSHFYIVKGTLKGKLFPSHGWEFHSFLPIEKFAELASDLIPEYDIEIIETYHREGEIIQDWEIK